MTESLQATGVFAFGPWWELGSFVRISVTDEHLVVTPVAGWIARRRAEQQVPLSQVAMRSRQTRRGFLGRPDVLICKVRVDNKSLTFKAPNFLYAIRVVDALQQWT